MSIGLKADSGGTSGSIQVGGVDKVTIDSSGNVSLTTTPTPGDNSTKVATTAFVETSFAKKGANTDITSLANVTSIAGQGYSPYAMRNRIINGAMAVDQRNVGASQTITAGAALAYTVDRFYAYCTGANVTGQQVAGSIANTYRYQFTGAASVTGVGFGTRLEAVNTADLAGSTATLQAKLKSSSLTSITWTAYYANTKDTFGTLASPTRTQIGTGTFTINSTEATYSAQISIGASATTGIEIVFTGGALLGSQTLTVGDIQIESGSVATPFERRQYGNELTLCQRYCWSGTMYLPASCNSTSVIASLGAFNFPVQMRAAPTIAAGNFTSQISFTGIGNGSGLFDSNTAFTSGLCTVNGINSVVTPNPNNRAQGTTGTLAGSIILSVDL